MKTRKNTALQPSEGTPMPPCAIWSLVCVVSEPWQAMTVKECMFYGNFRNSPGFVSVQEEDQDPRGITPAPIHLP